MFPNPIQIIKGTSLQISLYGVCIAVGILACMAVLFFYTRKKGMPSEIQDFVFLIGVIAIAFGFLAAKIFQAFYEFIETGVWNFYEAGITAMGGFIGGAAAFIGLYFLIGYFVFKGKKQGLHIKHFNTILRVAPICITIAHAFGRIGCLFAGCCHGKYLGQEPVFGGIKMLGTIGESNVLGYYVPTQLYEALFLFALFGLLTYLYFNKCNIVLSIYLIAYGVWRMFIEFFRGDAARVENLALNMTPSQWQSIIFILGGVLLIVLYAFVFKKPLFFKEEPFKEITKEKKA